MKIDNFFTELKRRNVYKVAVAYAVVAWLLIQAASILLPTFEAPTWVMKAFVVFLAFGFALVVFVSWTFEATPDGLKRTADVPPDVAAKLPSWSGRKFAAFVCSPASFPSACFFVGRYTATNATPGYTSPSRPEKASIPQKSIRLPAAQ